MGSKTSADILTNLKQVATKRRAKVTISERISSCLSEPAGGVGMSRLSSLVIDPMVDQLTDSKGVDFLGVGKMLIDLRREMHHQAGELSMCCIMTKVQGKGGADWAKCCSRRHRPAAALKSTIGSAA